MLIAYEDYTGLGYNRVPEDQFPKFEAMARQYALRYTFGRISKTDSPWNDSWDDNLRGLCEMIDMYYSKSNNQDNIISSYSNGKYSESYVTVDAMRVQTFNDKLLSIMMLYFTPEQLSRRMG